MTRYLHITGGSVYDPVNGIDGVVRDVCAIDGRVVASLPANVTRNTVEHVDADGCFVMAGGVEIHTHIASPRITGLGSSSTGIDDDQRDCLVMSPLKASRAYATLGYTTVIEAAVGINEITAVEAAIGEMSNLDVGFLLELGNDELVVNHLAQGRREEAIDWAVGLIKGSSAFGIKLVNPGGLIHALRTGHHRELASLDQPIAGTASLVGGGVTARNILDWACAVAQRARLAHPPHLHAGRLGMPGNVETTLTTLDAFEDQPVHLAHAQFYAYGKTPPEGYTGAASKLSDYLSKHRHVTADVGQLVFGLALAVTEDSLLEDRLRRVIATEQYHTANELSNTDKSQPSPTGPRPLWLRYSPDNPVHSLMWATGLELILSCPDLWHLSLSVDHPNGGPFTAYPRIIELLMSKTRRDEQLSRIHPYAVEHSRIAQINRELSLSEVAILTRAAPARALGLTHKGHLGPGAQADITIYPRVAPPGRSLFDQPRYVFKEGTLIASNGALLHEGPACLLTGPRSV